MNAPGKFHSAEAVTTMTSLQFNEHLGEAKLATGNGPVIVTEDGNPAYVMLSNADYQRLKNNQRPLTALESLQDPRPEADFAYEFDESFDHKQ